jgi:hypothetical protein
MVGLDAFFHVSREVLVDHCIGATGFQRGDHLGDFPVFHLWSLEHCDIRAPAPFLVLAAIALLLPGTLHPFSDSAK